MYDINHNRQCVNNTRLKKFSKNFEKMSSDDERNYLSKLSPFQVEVFAECLEHESAGMSLPMGAGKTRMSLVVANETTDKDKSVLIVAQSKNHIGTWTREINEVFGKDYGYYIYHSDYDKKYLQVRKVSTRFVITTPEVVRKFYRINNLETWLLDPEIRNEGMFGQCTVINYRRNPQPIECNDIIFSTHWGSLIVDEFHLISNITSLQGRGLLCIPALRKWLLSGTFFSDPNESHILSYYTMLNTDDNFPRNLPDTKRYIHGAEINGSKFEGVKKTTVSRDKIPIKINKKIHEVVVPLRPEEERIYMALRQIALDINHQLSNTEFAGEKKKFSSALLSMIGYLRQCITCAVVPVASMAIDVCSYGEVDIIPNRFFELLGELNLDEYLNDVSNVISSKIQKALEIASEHKKVVIFTSSRMIIDIIMSMVEGRNVYTLEGDMPGKKREKILEDCQNSDEFILFLTYKIGSSGLNVQFADTVIILDIEWMEATTSQAIARVARQGNDQEINVYILISNTGIENAIYKKQINKAQVINELQTGTVKTERDRFKVSDIIVLLEQENVSEKMRSIYIS